MLSIRHHWCFAITASFTTKDQYNRLPQITDMSFLGKQIRTQEYLLLNRASVKISPVFISVSQCGKQSFICLTNEVCHRTSAKQMKPCEFTVMWTDTFQKALCWTEAHIVHVQMVYRSIDDNYDHFTLYWSRHSWLAMGTFLQTYILRKVFYFYIRVWVIYVESCLGKYKQFCLILFAYCQSAYLDNLK